MRGLGGKGGLADGFSGAEDIRNRGVERSIPPTEAANLASLSVPHGAAAIGITSPVGVAVAGSSPGEQITREDDLQAAKRVSVAVGGTSGLMGQVSLKAVAVEPKKSDAFGTPVISTSDDGSGWVTGTKVTLHEAAKFSATQEASTNAASLASLPGVGGTATPLSLTLQRSDAPKAGVLQCEPMMEKKMATATPPVEQKMATATPPVEQKMATATPLVEKKMATTTPLVEKKMATTAPLVGRKGIMEAVQSTAEQLNMASRVAPTINQPAPTPTSKTPLVATALEKSVIATNLSSASNRGVTLHIQRPATHVPPPLRHSASHQVPTQSSLEKQSPPHQTKPSAFEATRNVKTNAGKVDQSSAIRSAQVPKIEATSFAVPSIAEAGVAATTKPDTFERKPSLTPREALNKAYSPYIQSTDSSLEAARARLRNAIAQTRLLRAAFTDRVYEKYRVVLRPVPEDATQIVKRLKLEPRRVRANLEEEMSFIKREKDMEKRESLNATGKNPEDVAVSGDQEGKDADTLEQLAFFGAGLSLVILPETEVDAGVEFFRKYKHRGPTDPETGQRVGGISSAAQAAAEVILDRVRKGGALRMERKRKIGELDSGSVSTEPSSKVEQEVMSRLQSLPQNGGELTSAADTQGDQTAEGPNLTPNKSTLGNGTAETVLTKGNGKEPKAKLPPLPLNLFSLSPSHDGLRMDGKMTAAALALKSCGVGATVPGVKTGVKASPATSQGPWKHPFPTSAAAQWLRTSAALKKSPSFLPLGLASKVSMKTAEGCLVRPMEVRKRRKMKHLRAKRYDSSLFPSAESSIRSILSSFVTVTAQRSDEEEQQKENSALLVSADVSCKRNEAGATQTHAASQAQTQPKRNFRKRRASEIGLFRNIQLQSAEEKKRRSQEGVGGDQDGPSIAFSVMCALGLIQGKLEESDDPKSGDGTTEVDSESFASFCAEETALSRLLRDEELRSFSERFMDGERVSSSKQGPQNKRTITSMTGASEHRQANFVASIRGGGESFLDHMESTNPTGRAQFQGNSISSNDAYSSAGMRIQQSADGRLQHSVSIASNMLGSLSAQESDLLQAANGMSSQVHLTTGINPNVGDGAGVRTSLQQSHPVTLPFRDQSRPGSVDPSSLWLQDAQSVRRELAPHGNQNHPNFGAVAGGDSGFGGRRHNTDDGDVVKYPQASHTTDMASAFQGAAVLQTHLGSGASPLTDGFGGACDHFGTAASAVSPPIVSLSPAHQAAAMARPQMGEGADYFASGLHSQRRAESFGRGSTDWASLRASASAAGLLPAHASLAATFGLSPQTIVNLQARERAARAFLAREHHAAAAAAAQAHVQAASVRHELGNGARGGDATLPHQPVSLLGASNGTAQQQYCAAAHPTQPFPQIGAHSTSAAISMLSAPLNQERSRVLQRNSKAPTVPADVGSGVQPLDDAVESKKSLDVASKCDSSSTGKSDTVREAVQTGGKPSQQPFVEGTAADPGKAAGFGEPSMPTVGASVVVPEETQPPHKPPAPHHAAISTSLVKMEGGVCDEGTKPEISLEKEPVKTPSSCDVITSAPCEKEVGEPRKNGLNGKMKATVSDQVVSPGTVEQDPERSDGKAHARQQGADDSKREGQVQGLQVGSHFVLPKAPPQINQSWASLIASSRFHLVAEIIDGEQVSSNQIQIALLYLLAVGSAVPIQKSLIHEAFRDRLDLTNSNGLSESHEVSDGALWKLREIVAAAILVWLWVHHEEDFRCDVDWKCRCMINAAVDASVEKLRSSEALRNQLKVYKDVSDKSPSSQTPRNGDSVSVGNVKDEAWIGLNLRTASVVNRALVTGVDWSSPSDLVLGHVNDFLRALDDDRMMALRLKSQERILVATLLSRRVKISESFALAYTSALVRAGDALGYDDMCEIVQDRDTLGSSLLPFDIFISDTTGAWEDPCRPSCGFTRGLTGDELVRRAHARAAIHKALRKLQDRHGIRGGVRDSGPYADPPPINSTDGSPPLQAHASSSAAKASSQSNRRESILKRKASTFAEAHPGFVVFGTPHSSATAALFDPNHSSTPFIWDSEDNSHMPYGRRGGPAARPKALSSRSRSDGKGGRTDSSSRRTNEKLTGDRTADVRSKEGSKPESTGPCSREIDWSTVAAMFQPVSFGNAGGPPSPSPRRAVKPVAVTRGSSADTGIVAPLCRTIDEMLTSEDEQSDDDSEDEDTSDETMLRKHQVVLDKMKQRHDKFMESRQHQTTERSRRRTR